MYSEKSKGRRMKSWRADDTVISLVFCPLELASGCTRIFAVVCLFVCHIAVVLPLSCCPLVPLPPRGARRRRATSMISPKHEASSRGKGRKPPLIFSRSPQSAATTAHRLHSRPPATRRPVHREHSPGPTVGRMGRRVNQPPIRRTQPQSHHRPAQTHTESLTTHNPHPQQRPVDRRDEGGAAAQIDLDRRSQACRLRARARFDRPIDRRPTRPVID